MKLLKKTKISELRERYDFIIGWGAAKNEFERRYNVSMYQMDDMIDGGESKTGRVLCGYKIQKMDILKKVSGGQSFNYYFSKFRRRDRNTIKRILVRI